MFFKQQRYNHICQSNHVCNIVPSKNLVDCYKSDLITYLTVRCHNIYDAMDIWKEVNLQIQHHNVDISRLRQIMFKVAIKILNNRVYKSQYKQLISMNMDAELNEIGLAPNDFWLRIKKTVSAKVYDILWLSYKERFSIHEISIILEKKSYLIKLVIRLNEERFSKKCEFDELLSICLLKV